MLTPPCREVCLPRDSLPNPSPWTVTNVLQQHFNYRFPSKNSLRPGSLLLDHTSSGSPLSNTGPNGCRDQIKMSAKDQPGRKNHAVESQRQKQVQKCRVCLLRPLVNDFGLSPPLRIGRLEWEQLHLSVECLKVAV